jgi:hypothetical protein
VKRARWDDGTWPPRIRTKEGPPYTVTTTGTPTALLTVNGIGYTVPRDIARLVMKLKRAAR